ncbi:MAG: 4-alpha-glucanotransferase, partial [Verrucomicrobia bacterium]|nr:4-alpha-glucanotransferase [Verrucomicrobiota bacterium]
MNTHWAKIGKRAHHGICVPLFSLHSKRSPRCGTFLDLIPLIDWCKEVGFDVIQLLPLNDSGDDLSPYNPISSCALHPKYLSLWELGVQSQDQLFRLSKTPPASFTEKHPWLTPYAAFRALKEQYHGAAWTQWPKGATADPKRVEFYTFLQFHAFEQMAEAKRHADEQGVFLMGDLPFLVSPDSADVWDEPHLFDLHLEAGSPPDAFNLQGQRWGFPLINWAEMRKSQFAWWKRRLHTLETLVHMYRLDHVIGFFRTWGIERGKQAVEGSYYPAEPSLWEQQGTAILEMMLGYSPLLPIAEDLGTTFEGMASILKRFGICGTRVMPWQIEEGRYTPPEQYEPLSVTTLGTHDMPTLAVWWKTYPQMAKQFAEALHLNYQPLLNQTERLALLRAAHSTSS